MWKFHFFRAPSFFKCWIRLWKGPKDKNQALKWQLLWWEGVFQHGPQLNFRAPSSTMDLGPQLNHARFRIYYRGGTWETRRLVFRRQISCRWRCRCVLVQIIMYFDMEKNVKIPCFSRPLIYYNAGYDSEKVRKIRIKHWNGNYYDERAYFSTAPSSTSGPPAQLWIWAPSSTTLDLGYITGAERGNSHTRFSPPNYM